jgi:hypothetical protein
MHLANRIHRLMIDQDLKMEEGTSLPSYLAGRHSQMEFKQIMFPEQFQ